MDCVHLLLDRYRRGTASLLNMRGLLASMLALGFLSVIVPAQAQTLAPSAWTLDEAVQQFQLYPRDPYLQYVVLQMARDTDRFDEISQMVRRSVGRAQRGDRGPQTVNAFGVFSGALAIQESLQLDRLTSETNPRDTDAEAVASTVPISSLTGPTIQSHPWSKMLAGQTPEVSRLSRCVPEDFFFVESRSLNRLLDLKELFDLWGRHVLTQTTETAHSQLFADHLLEQLAIDDDGTFRALYDTAVGRVALTGSDVFFREGTDVTVLFEVKQPALFKARMELYLVAARQAHPDATTSQGTVQGVDYTALTTPDRHVNSFTAEPEPNLFIRSNSLVGLSRVIAAIKGQDAAGKTVNRLGDSLEFAYIRTLMPNASDQEDVLVYLSDPFIRRLVGPQLKLTELRRMHCYNQMRMIGHASLLYQTQTGKAPESLDDLVFSGCAPPDFAERILKCPDGGAYSITDRKTARCTHHGHADAMTPCCEHPVTHVTRQEAELYNTFLNQYNQYWRRFFDPIAVRIKQTPESYRIETIILPLIDNTLYTGLSMAFNGEPRHLDQSPTPDRSIFTTAVRLNKAAIAGALGAEELLRPDERNEATETQAATNDAGNKFRQLGLALHNYHDTHSTFPPASRGNNVSRDLSWRVHVLPFLDELELYNEFKLNEPWDSPHNKRLIARMPDVFRSENAELNRAGKTRIQMPVGKGMFYDKPQQSIAIRSITDGTSNTAMLVESADAEAAVWTQPDDLEIDRKQPIKQLHQRDPGAFLILMADGSVQLIRQSIPAATLTGLLTRQGGEIVEISSADRLPLRLQRNSRRRSREEEQFRQLGVGEFLVRGIGDRVGLHLYDVDPLFGFSMLEFLGEVIRSSSNQGLMDDEILFVGAMIASITAPVYASFEIQDTEIVDQFMERLDVLLAELARKPPERQFIEFRQDFGFMSGPDNLKIRDFAFKIGPAKLRIFWSRIGNELVIASKPFILEDLARLSNTPVPSQESDPAAVGHAMIRMRPEHWDRILGSFELGWSEAHRSACISNLGPLSSMQRAARSLNGQGAVDAPTIEALAASIYDAHFFCPDGGHYHATPDGKHMECSLHGTALAPRQLGKPGPQSGLARFLKEFQQLTMTLTFLEDGLHAVVTIDRKTP